MLTRVQVAFLACATLGTLSACKFEKTADLAARAEHASGSSAAVETAEEWKSKILPYFENKASPFTAIASVIAGKGLDAAGKSYGYRDGGSSAPWGFVASVEGTIVEANTGSRAASAGIDTDGDGKADVTVQIGPVIRGTAIRDVLPFVSFSDYKNQIEFAKVAKALNEKAYDNALKDLPRDRLVGSRISAVGAMTVRKPGGPFLVTPVVVELKAPAA